MESSIFPLPLMFMGLYGYEATPLIYQLVCFTLCIVSMSVIMTYIRLKIDSRWPAVIFHMSHNVFLQKFFGSMTEVKANSAWFVDEFGAVVPAVLLVLAVFFWKKGKSEFQPESTRQIIKH